MRRRPHRRVAVNSKGPDEPKETLQAEEEGALQSAAAGSNKCAAVTIRGGQGRSAHSRAGGMAWHGPWALAIVGQCSGCLLALKSG